MVLLEQTVMCVTGDVVDGVNGGRKFFSNNILDQITIVPTGKTNYTTALSLGRIVYRTKPLKIMMMMMMMMMRNFLFNVVLKESHIMFNKLMKESVLIA
jgi:hypothetical protein